MALVTLDPQYQRVAGHIHGLPQSATVFTVQIGADAAAAAAALAGFLAERLPEAQPPAATGDGPDSLARLLAFWAGELQRQARIAVSPRFHVERLPATAQPAPRFQLVLPQRHPQAGPVVLGKLVQAANLLHGATAPAGPLLEPLFAELAAALKPAGEPGYNQFHLVEAALRNGIPVRTVDHETLLLGTGARLQVMASTLTSETSAYGMVVSQDKWRTARALRAIGLPVPAHELVQDADQAVQAAHRLGYPVVVKPADQDQGRGVAAHLRTDEQVRRAHAAAAALSKRVLVEKHCEGFGHRITVHHGSIVAVLRRIPGSVTGDGSSTVAQLVEQALAAPRPRGSVNMGRVALDPEALELLAGIGLGPDSVPEAGRLVVLRRRDNISAGGRAESLTPQEVHPDNLLLARRAASALYLDLAGVDILSPDIAKSWRECPAVICEVNGRPQFGPGPAGDNYDRVLARVLGAQPRIPVHLYITGQAPAAGLRAHLDALCRAEGIQAHSSAEGVWVDGACHGAASGDAWAAARSALIDRGIGSLLAAVSLSDIAARGLPIDRFDSVRVAPQPRAGAAQRRLLDAVLGWTGAGPQAIHFEATPP